MRQARTNGAALAGRATATPWTALRMLSTPASTTKTATPNAAKAAKGGAAKAGGKKVKKDGSKSISDHLSKFILAAEDAKKFKPEFSEEELAEHTRIGRIYQQKTTQRANMYNKDISTKIWMQQEALRALPDNLRIKAEELDESPPPPDRPWPIWMTPPIKDFDYKKFTRAKGEEGEDDEEEIGSSEKK
jgi:hypothetical protein